MRRREFTAGLVGAAAWPLVARAQRSALPVVGFLDWATRRPEANPALTAFRQGLAAVGFIENQNVAIEFREANGQFARLPVLATELVNRRVSVVVVIDATNAVLEAKRATSTIPIVFEYDGDPVRDGIVASLNRPGGNITGVTLFNSELGSKRLSLLLSLVPQAKTIAFLGFQRADEQHDQILASARALGREVIILATRGEAYEDAFKPLLENPADALILGNFTFRNRSKIMALAARYKIPAIYPNRNYALNGGLMSYGAAIPDIFRVVGNYTGRILNGEKPADLPVQFPTKYEMVVNLKTAKALGLTIPPNQLAVADEVIE
jgi:putative ABC transport system substrate-binding protein